MVKKIKQNIWTIVAVTISIIVLVTALLANYKIYISVSHRFLEIFDMDNLKNFFENYLYNNRVIYDNLVVEVTQKIDGVIVIIKDSKSLKEILINHLSNCLIFIVNFFNYFCNIGINIIMLLSIYYHETFNSTNIKIKYTFGARIFIKIKRILYFISRKIISFLKGLIKNLKIHKRKIAFTVLIFLIGTGWLYKIIVEVLIFFISYIYHAIKLETYIILFSLGQFLFLFSYPNLKILPYPIIIIFIIIIILFRAFVRANFKLRMNHERLKRFAANTLTQTTFINGAPGVGKTLLNVSLSLASEENYIDELFKELIEYELKYPDVNFAEVRRNSEPRLEHTEYLKIIDTLRCRGTFLISNFSIYSPYFREYSKIFDFDFMRKNLITSTYPLEEYIVISLSELDKEYNSHDDMKAVGIDGAATFFSTTSHDLKRHVKIFCDYQLKDQVPLRIRGNSEYFINVKQRKKKYPFLLYIYYLPFLGLSKLVRVLIRKYETKSSTITKRTKRKEVPVYKRNDYNFIYAVLRNLGFTLNKICEFFDQYWYFKLSCILSQEDTGKGKAVNINLNLCDLAHENMKLFDSTFLSYAYEKKKNKDFKDLVRFTGLRPTIEELSLCHSRFYDKLNGINLSTSKKEKPTIEDEYIEV